jgi:nucleoside-diphosphate-sugar epimerase
MTKRRREGVKVLLTGGSGDLGTVLTPQLEARGDTAVRLDIVPPRDPRGRYVAGSVLDRAGLGACLRTVDCVVHMAAWHGVHEGPSQSPQPLRKDVYAFWDLNVTGTFNVFEAAVQAGVAHVVYLASTSVRNRQSVYGHTKVLGEEIAQTYAGRHGLNVVILRPRGFIPHWNRAVYSSFVEWLQWFWRGAVHIDDVAAAVVQSLALLAKTRLAVPLVLAVDGAYEYTEEDLAHWDAQGPGSTFRRYYGAYEELARRHGLVPEAKHITYDLAETRRWLGYTPRYSLREALRELERYGPAGPPPPYG